MDSKIYQIYQVIVKNLDFLRAHREIIPVASQYCILERYPDMFMTPFGAKRNPQEFKFLLQRYFACGDATQYIYAVFPLRILSLSYYDG